MIPLNQHFILPRVDRPSHQPHLNTRSFASRHQPLTKKLGLKPRPFRTDLILFDAVN